MRCTGGGIHDRPLGENLRETIRHPRRNGPVLGGSDAGEHPAVAFRLRPKHAHTPEHILPEGRQVGAAGLHFKIIQHIFVAVVAPLVAGAVAAVVCDIEGLEPRRSGCQCPFRSRIGIEDAAAFIHVREQLAMLRAQRTAVPVNLHRVVPHPPNQR